MAIQRMSCIFPIENLPFQSFVQQNDQQMQCCTVEKVSTTLASKPSMTPYAEMTS